MQYREFTWSLVILSQAYSELLLALESHVHRRFLKPQTASKDSMMMLGEPELVCIVMMYAIQLTLYFRPSRDQKKVFHHTDGK